jgi:MFS family permease
MFVFIRETGTRRSDREPLHLLRGLRNLDGRLKLYLAVVFVFTLGNSSNAFLLLRAAGAGFDPGSVILLYFLYSLVSSLLALPLGRMSDRVGRKRLLVAGYLVFALVYALFAWSGGREIIVMAFALYGVFTALTAGVERAFIAEIAPQELKGTVLGLHSTIQGIALLPASVAAGVLWTAFGPAVPFALGAALAFAAALTLGFGLPRHAVPPAAPAATVTPARP